MLAFFCIPLCIKIIKNPKKIKIISHKKFWGISIFDIPPSSFNDKMIPQTLSCESNELIIPKSFLCVSLVHSIKREFNSETKDSNIDNSRRMTSTQAPPKKVDGVGPTTQQGMPLSLRSVSLAWLCFALIYWSAAFDLCRKLMTWTENSGTRKCTTQFTKPKMMVNNWES